MYAPRALLLVLVVLNSLVLLGRLCLEGAPPFAGIVNIAFLLMSLGLFGRLLVRHPRA